MPSLIGSKPNQISTNGDLGRLAFMDNLDSFTSKTVMDTDITNIAPSLNLDFANSKALDPRITFTRASTATFYNGVSSAVAEQNLQTWSQDFTNAAWTKTNAAITANSTTAPDGTTTASTLTPDTVTTSGHRIGGSSIAGFTLGSHSVYVKANGYTKCALRESAASGYYASFDLTAVSVLAQTATLVTNASIVSVGNGWYRISMTVNSAGSQGLSLIVLDNSYTNTNPYSYSYAGDGTSGIFIWGAQLEQRSAVTAYTPTTTAAVTNYIPTLSTAAAGVARFDHNPITGESLGLEIEEQRSNLIVYSSQFDDGAWTKLNSPVITSNINIAPDGTQTAELFTNSSSGGRIQQNTTVANATSHTLSCYAKISNVNFFCLGFGGLASAIFNLATGAVSNTVGTSTTSITPVGNGWYRCTITATSTSTSLINVMGPSATNTFGFGTYPDGVAGNAVFIWGAQLEAGAFATSYIPTVASQVTRSPDAASMTGTNFSSWYNPAEGTVYTNIGYSNGGSFPYVFTIESSDNNRIFIHKAAGVATSATAFNAQISQSGTTQADFTLSSLSTKMILAYRTNDTAGLSDITSTVTTDTVCLTPLATYLFIGGYPSGRQLNGTIKKLSYYPRRLNNSELVEMTA